MLRWLGFAVSALCFLGLASGLSSQDKKKADKKTEPKVIVALPLGVQPGTSAKLTIRGANLETATDVQFMPAGVVGRISSKGKSGVPDKNPEKVGDTQIVVDLKIPAGLKENVSFVVRTPDGDTRPHVVLVETELKVLKEKEPNDGFRQAQTIELPVVIEGTIDRPRDVDVFAFTGKKGQKIHAEIHAARFGSALDGMLTLYNKAGNQIAFSDDVDGSHDPRIEQVLPADDTYYLVLMDAHDTGSNVHAYRLVVK